MVAQHNVVELRCHGCGPSATVALPKMLLLVIVCTGHLVGAQSNGHVRITHDPINTTTADWGRLEVYLDGEWGTFCANGFNSYAADAACRQLGFQYSLDISKAGDKVDDIPLASNSTPIHTGYSRCGKSTQ